MISNKHETKYRHHIWTRLMQLNINIITKQTEL